ncbi:MAG: hypothetical protein ABI193_07060, partial [Minicystis sp.]
MITRTAMLRRLLNEAGGHFDRLAGAAIFYRSPSSLARSRTEGLGAAERIAALAQIASVYDRPEHLDPDGPFFARPAPIDPEVCPVRSIPGGSVADWRWPSPFVPHDGDIAGRYLEQIENRTAAARVFLHGDRPRPTAILLHGY